jgi:site-specific recombinase XerD
VKYVIDNQIVLAQVPEGPVSAHIESFARSLREQGYAQYSIHRQVLLGACFSRWLKQKGIALTGITSDHPIQYLRFRSRRVRPSRGDAAALKHLLDFLRGANAVPVERMPRRTLTPVERYTQAYEQHLRDARGLASATIINYVPFIRSFLTNLFGANPVRLSRLCAGDIVSFVQQQAPRLHPKRAKLLTSALRSFLQYARYRGQTKLELAAAVPVVPNWSRSSIPRAIAADQIRQLLDSIDQHTAVGRRDYAILLLLARLGLRSGEVTTLELDDIDWNAGQLSVRGKSGQRNELPLPADVGKAMAVYLQRGRPRRCTSRRVFLRARAPIRGFRGASGVGSIVRHRLQRAGIDAPTFGAHQFRHRLATELLHQGASLGEIGELLGHRSPETTKIYTQVDLDALRTLALPWPGGAQ